MELHLLELGRRQLAGLIENVFRHGDLASVVQERRGFDGLDGRLIGDTKLLRQRDGPHLDAPDVPVRDFVLRIDGRGERFDGREIQALERGHMSLLILDAPE